VSILAYVFGVEVTGGVWDARSALGLLVTIIVPAVANLHNSYTDLAEDAENLPGRLGLVERAGLRPLMFSVRGGLAVVLVSCAYMGAVQLLIAVIGAGLLLSYSAPPIRAKARPIAGLVVFSMVVSVPFLMGATVAAEWGQTRSPLATGPLVWLVFMSLLFLAKGMVKNVPDYHGDLAAGIRNSSTVCGSIGSAARWAIWGTWAVYACLPVAVWLSGARPAMYLAAAWGLFALWHVARLARTDDPAFLNTVMKWDMSVTTVTLSLLAITARGSVTAIAVVVACFAVHVAAELTHKDSREPEHLALDGAR
jgi:4-hydroxybenzoate polyprenyltransferase